MQACFNEQLYDERTSSKRERVANKMCLHHQIINYIVQIDEIKEVDWLLTLES
jgi:hypothetical protein